MRTPEEIARAIDLLSYALAYMPVKEAKQVNDALRVLLWALDRETRTPTSFAALLDSFEKRRRVVEDAMRAQNN